MIAALDLDMVGGDQSLCRSAMTVEQAPASFANYADDLVVRLVEGTSSGATNYACLEGQSVSRHAVTPFSGGSDRCLLIDPSVGVPCRRINQWPDKSYHTSADTLDKVDPSTLARVGGIAASGRSHEHQELLVGYVQSEIINRHHIAESLRYVVVRYTGHLATLSLPTLSCAARETVATESPASSATSPMVAESLLSTSSVSTTKTAP